MCLHTDLCVCVCVCQTEREGGKERQGGKTLGGHANATKRRQTEMEKFWRGQARTCSLAKGTGAV